MALKHYSLLVLSMLIIQFPSKLYGGCYQRQLCCAGKNNSCKSKDDGISHLPIASRWPDQFPDNYNYDRNRRPPSVYLDNNNEKLGRLILPDVVQLNSDGVRIIEEYSTESEENDYLLSDQIFDDENNIDYIDLSDPEDETMEILHFGEEFEEKQESQLRYIDNNRTHAYIRYKIINKYIPVRIEKRKQKTRHRMRFGKTNQIKVKKTKSLFPIVLDGSTDIKKVDKNNGFRYNTHALSDCYCDNRCVTFGDCCSDFHFTCSPLNCQTGDWSRWSECIVDGEACKCGEGERTRSREIIRRAENGGARCGALVEKIACFRTCQKEKKIVERHQDTPAALILDYQYNTTRRHKKEKFWKNSEIERKLATLTYYCVEYKIIFLNRNCITQIFKKTLTPGATICAECQPEAQLHRNDQRCSSDLENGDVGFWKLIGPKSCNGIWKRETRTNNCTCNMLPNLTPYLLV
uniref:SMB domain-containing protein n=1 Tax=Rhabditophanes sp. KR3021 TaxID=114890 RepID=A0AC35UAP3_9BILA